MQGTIGTVQQDSGLTAAEQINRTRRARKWAARIIALMEISGASATIAVKAVEQADTEKAS